MLCVLMSVCLAVWLCVLMSVCLSVRPADDFYHMWTHLNQPSSLVLSQQLLVNPTQVMLLCCCLTTNSPTDPPTNQPNAPPTNPLASLTGMTSGGRGVG